MLSINEAMFIKENHQLFEAGFLKCEEEVSASIFQGS